jgi:hypothetical protein
VNAGGFFAAGPDNPSTDPKAGFLAVDNQHGALRPVDRGEKERSVKIYYRRDDV